MLGFRWIKSVPERPIPGEGAPPSRARHCSPPRLAENSRVEPKNRIGPSSDEPCRVQPKNRNKPNLAEFNGTEPNVAAFGRIERAQPNQGETSPTLRPRPNRGEAYEAGRTEASSAEPSRLLSCPLISASVVTA